MEDFGSYEGIWKLRPEYRLSLHRTSKRRRLFFGEYIWDEPVTLDDMSRLLSKHPDWVIERDKRYPEDHFVARIPDPPGAILCYVGGRVYMRNPSAEATKLLLEIAAEFDMRVRGDGFETYRTPYDTYIHPHDETKAKDSNFVRNLRNRAKAMPWTVEGPTPA